MLQVFFPSSSYAFREYTCVLFFIFLLLIKASVTDTFIGSPTHCSPGHQALISVYFVLVHSQTWFHQEPHTVLLNESVVCVRACLRVRLRASIGLLFTALFSFNKASALPLGPVYSRTPREDVNPGLICSHRTPTWCFLARLISLMPPPHYHRSPLEREELAPNKQQDFNFHVSRCDGLMWWASSDHFSLRCKYDRVKVLTPAILP